MRVTSNTYSNLLINSSQNSQQQLAAIQQQISTGQTVQYASDNPLLYAQSAQAQTSHGAVELLLHRGNDGGQPGRAKQHGNDQPCINSWPTPRSSPPA